MSEENVYNFLRGLSRRERGILAEEVGRKLSYLNATASRSSGLSPVTAIKITFSNLNKSLDEERQLSTQDLRDFLQIKLELEGLPSLGI